MKKDLIEYWTKKRDNTISFLKSNEEGRERRKRELEEQIKIINSTIAGLKNVKKTK